MDTKQLRVAPIGAVIGPLLTNMRLGSAHRPLAPRVLIQKQKNVKREYFRLSIQLGGLNAPVCFVNRDGEAVCSFVGSRQDAYTGKGDAVAMLRLRILSPLGQPSSEPPAQTLREALTLRVPKYMVRVNRG